MSGCAAPGWSRNSPLRRLSCLESALPLGPQEAALAAEIYKGLRRPRGREVDIAIAAFAITRDAVLWTLNLQDFRDIAGLRMSLPG